MSALSRRCVRATALAVGLLLGSAGAFMAPLASSTRRFSGPSRLFSASSSPEAGLIAEMQQAGEAVSREWDRVELRVYDISQGYADMLGAVLQKPIEGIWHVGVAVFGKEYWFSTLIESKDLQDTEFAFGMAPKMTMDMGRTSVTVEEFERFLEEELADQFTIKTYNVFENNCNHFAEKAIKYLTGGEGNLPPYVLELSDTALDNMPRGQAAITRMVTNQAARVVMLAWGKATRSKEQLAKREERMARIKAREAEEEAERRRREAEEGQGGLA